MFEKMATHGGGTITLEFENEPIEEDFRKLFKTEKEFLKTIPDELNESSENFLFRVHNPTSLVDNLFTKSMTKFSGPTKEQFDRYTENIEAARKVEENKDEDCRICLNFLCLGRKKSFEENIYEKAVKEFTKNE